MRRQLSYPKQEIYMGVNNIKIPPEFNYIEVYLTLKCNFNCSYCINKLTGISEIYEMPGDQLSQYLNRLELIDRPLTIGGGEPTIRKDFYDIIDALTENIKIDLLTNLSFDLKEFVNRIPPCKFYSSTMSKPAYKSIRVSFHPSTMNAHKLVTKAQELQEQGYSIGIFGINHPENTEHNIEMSEIARENKVYFFIKDFLGYYKNQLFGFYHHPDGLNGTEKKCLCRTKEVLIGPNGNIFKCHRDLYQNEYPINNISNNYLKIIDYKMRSCSKFGQCNPCDLKIKTNRYLQMGSQATEITL